ncbi:hypothetical protein PV703_14480 [Streptomyces sp. ME01-24h]|nr:hypothetical protein [Streptomyces sp. ME19-03-3]MDX3354489.1 hypothetical protein [Streptomyces sp. ME01-24h]
MTGTWSPREPVPSRTDWARVAAVFPLMLLLSLVVLRVQPGSFLAYAVATHTEDCGQVERYAGGTVPAGATDLACTNSGSLNDRDYAIDFRMPGPGAEDRLLDAFPRLRQESRCATDACFRIQPDEPADAGRSGYLEATVEYEGDRAHVHVLAT